MYLAERVAEYTYSHRLPGGRDIRCDTALAAVNIVTRGHMLTGVCPLVDRWYHRMARPYGFFCRGYRQAHRV